jgi:hypothetical protein
MLPSEEQQRRDRWLAECEGKPFKTMVYVGKEVTVADVERWLRDALTGDGDAPASQC